MKTVNPIGYLKNGHYFSFKDMQGKTNDESDIIVPLYSIILTDKLKSEETQIKENLSVLDQGEKLRPSFWFMRDNHTFIPLIGENLLEIQKQAIKIAKENPYGMLCPVTILKGDEELRRVGKSCHADKKGNIVLDEWYNEVVKEDCVRYYGIPQPQIKAIEGETWDHILLAKGEWEIKSDLCARLRKEYNPPTKIII